MAAATPAPPPGPRAARPAHWFPLALFGALVALSVPLYTPWLNTSPVFSGWVAYAPLSRSVTSSPPANAAYSSSFSVLLSSPGGFFGVPEGWYWAAALTVGFLATSFWYRRTGRGRSLPYLITGLLLTAAITVVPLLVIPRAPFPAWLWLSGEWGSGTFALLVIAVAWWILARRAHSRPLAIVALAYTMAALVADWPTLSSSPSALLVTGGDPLRTLVSIGSRAQSAEAALLPAGVLLVSAAVALALPARFRGKLPAAWPAGRPGGGTGSPCCCSAGRLRSRCPCRSWAHAPVSVSPGLVRAAVTATLPLLAWGFSRGSVTAGRWRSSPPSIRRQSASPAGLTPRRPPGFPHRPGGSAACCRAGAVGPGRAAGGRELRR